MSLQLQVSWVMLPSGGENGAQQQWSPSGGWKIHCCSFHLLACVVPHLCSNESCFWFRFCVRLRVRLSLCLLLKEACAVRMRFHQARDGLLSRNAPLALARCLAGQQRHIKPSKLHHGNKMAIKWQQQCINPSPGSAEGTVKSSGWSREWFLGLSAQRLQSPFSLPGGSEEQGRAETLTPNGLGFD